MEDISTYDINGRFGYYLRIKSQISKRINPDTSQVSISTSAVITQLPGEMMVRPCTITKISEAMGTFELFLGTVNVEKMMALDDHGLLTDEWQRSRVSRYLGDEEVILTLLISYTNFGV